MAAHSSSCSLSAERCVSVDGTESCVARSGLESRPSYCNVLTFYNCVVHECVLLCARVRARMRVCVCVCVCVCLLLLCYTLYL